MTSLTERTSNYLRALRIPVLFLVIGIGMLAAYYSLYVRDNAAYLTGRNLRLVANVASQIETALADHQTVLSSFSTYYGPEHFRNGFRCIARLATPFVPMFEYVSLDAVPGTAALSDAGCDERFQRGKVTPEPAPVAVEFVADYGATWSGRPAGAAASTAAAQPFRVALRDVVSPLFSNYGQEGVFDSLLLATTSGRIVHQAAVSDLRLTTLNRLIRKQTDGTWKELDFSNLPLTSQVLEVVMSGGQYLLYLQPCCSQLAEDGKREGNAGLVVAGLVDAAEFRGESMAVSFSMMALTGAAILLAIFSWPFLKLLLIGEGQRLRLIDVLLVGMCSLLGTTLVTVFVVDWFAYGVLKGEIDEQLQRLSVEIRQNVASELALAVDQLEKLDRWASVQTGAGDRTPDLFSLQHDPVYPLMESFALIGRDGMQVRKWAVAEFTTPLVSASRRDYFRHWIGPHPKDPPYFLQSIRSATTGRKEAALSKPASQSSGASVAALTIPMISLTEAVLPSGFGFAVIDEEGKVLFHATSRQRLDEQLFLETDRHRRLRAAVTARRAELMNVRYFGRDHRFFVAPLEKPERSNWSLITFEDKEPIRTINIEWLVTTWLFALIYIGMYVVLSGIVFTRRPRYRAAWMWPDPARESAYGSLICSYGAFAIAFGAAITSLRGGQLLWVAWILPFIVWSATYLVVTDGDRPARPAKRKAWVAGLCAAAVFFWFLRGDLVRAGVIAAFVALGFALPVLGVRARLRHPYTIAAVLLLVLTAVFPTLAFFKVAHAIQIESFIKHEQLRIARQLQGRLAEAHHEADGSRSRNRPEIARRLSGLRETLSVYDKFFFDTQTCQPGDEASRRSSTEAMESALPKPLEDLLPYYSEASVGMRELLHDRSSDTAWEWRRMNAQLVLYTPAAPAGEALCLRSSVPVSFGGLAGGGEAPAVAKAVFLAGVVLLAVYWIVRFIERRIFLVDVVPPLWARLAGHFPRHPGSNLYIRWRASERQAQTLAGDGWCVIDMAQCPGGTTAADWFRAQRERLDDCSPGETVAIDHLGEAVLDATCDAGTLALIHYALDVQHRTVTLVSGVSVDVVLRRIAERRGASAEEAASSAAWTATLRRFTVIDAPRVEAAAQPVTPTLGPAALQGSASAGATNSVSRPPGATVELGEPFLLSVWTEVRRAAAEQPGPTPLDEEQLFEEVGDRLDSHYRGLWSSCSDADKLVLQHLAQEGLVNHKDRRTIRLLMARGLIRKGGGFQLADETFRRFILSGSIGTQVAELEQRSDSAWDDIRVPFFGVLLATSAFFFLTQRELFTTTMAAVAALAGGIPAIVRVAGIFDRSSARSFDK